MPRALITGPGGQDGWYLTELLLADGYEVFGLRRPNSTTPLPPGLTPLDGDLADSEAVDHALAAAAPDEVYNLAGLSSVAQSWRQPATAAEINGVAVLRLLDAARRSGRDVRVVQAGSAEIFGTAAAPQNERTPIAPTTPYGAAKALGQHAVSVYRATGMFVSSAILYNHESPRRTMQFVTRKITSAVARIARGSSEPLVLGNLSARRDWGHARDYVRAMTLIVRHGTPDDFVIATGVAHSVADFVAAAFMHVGIEDWQSHVRTDDRLTRPTDPGELRGDPSRARELLGWKAETSFKNMIAEMVDADLAAAHEAQVD